eukprot:scaffold940_cov262-Pinguiococcus_pyrenoidosus.AAC.12
MIGERQTAHTSSAHPSSAHPSSAHPRCAFAAFFAALHEAPLAALRGFAIGVWKGAAGGAASKLGVSASSTVAAFVTCCGCARGVRTLAAAPPEPLRVRSFLSSISWRHPCTYVLSQSSRLAQR